MPFPERLRLPFRQNRDADNQTQSLPAEQSQLQAAEQPLLQPVKNLYQPLNDSEIRLLEMEPSDDDEAPIDCKLYTISLAKISPFSALSYVWGDAAVTKNITVNKMDFAVTVNLHSALKHIRKVWSQSPYELPRQPLWVDAICIDQQGTSERNHQVAMMGKIFSGASLTISWLHEGNEKCTLAIDTLREFGSTSMEQPVDSGWNWLSRCSQILHGEEHKQGLNKPWHTVRSLLRLPYFKRIWILQELVLSRNCKILVGTQTLEWQYLQSSMTTLKALAILSGEGEKPEFMTSGQWKRLTRSYPDVKQNLVSLVLKMKDAMQRQQQFPLYYNVLETYRLQASDPRDKIFALLNISDTAFSADYSQTVEKVYVSFARDWVNYRDFRKLEVLYCYTGVGSDLARSHDLPSWVPDLEAASIALHEKSLNGSASKFWNRVGEVFCADAGIESEVLYITHENHLVANGTRPTCISALIGCLHKLTVGSMAWYITEAIRLVHDRQSFGWIEFQALCRTLVGNLGLVPEHRLTWEFDLEDLCRVFLLHYIKASRIQRSQEVESDITLKQNLLYSAPENVTAFVLGKEWKDTDILQYSKSTIRGMYYTKGPLAFRYLRFGLTEEGDFIMAPRRSNSGDVVCVLGGCTMPVLLRYVDGHYLHVGPCYVDGLMNGEAAEMMRKGKVEMETFEIH